MAIYSDVDKLSLHTKFADEAICIGPADSSKSYLNIPSILSAAEFTNADAIHPGYGFLSENSDFSTIVDNNLTFIGPSSDIISVMGDKASARDTMRKLNIPIIPGSIGIVNNSEEGLEIARFWFPVIIKASSGGGGRGMRIVNDSQDFKNFYTAQSEAKYLLMTLMFMKNTFLQSILKYK